MDLTVNTSSKKTAFFEIYRESCERIRHENSLANWRCLQIVGFLKIVAAHD